MLLLQNITYLHPNRDLLFANINLTLNRHTKAALIGNNGAGKSTLLQIIAGVVPPSVGQLSVAPRLYHVPQIFGQFNKLTVAQALQIENKLKSLKEILEGKMTEENLLLLGDDWTIEERCQDALQY